MIYQNSPINKTVRSLTPGYPAYLFGSLNLLVAPTKMRVTSVTVASTVVTLGVAVVEGNVPVAGQLVSVAYTTSDGGKANVTNVAISDVTIDAITGAGTISYTAVTSPPIGDQVLTADSGEALAPQAEVGEALVNGASQEIAIQANTGPNNGRTIRFDVSFPSIPTTATVIAQSADLNLDSEYYDISATPVATVAGGVVSGGSSQFSMERSCFVRVIVSSVTGGTNPAIAVKVTE